MDTICASVWNTGVSVLGGKGKGWEHMTLPTHLTQKARHNKVQVCSRKTFVPEFHLT